MKDTHADGCLRIAVAGGKGGAGKTTVATNLAVEMARALELDFGALINRSDIGNEEVGLYCARENIPLLLEIPDDRGIAEAYSRGLMTVQAVPRLGSRLTKLWEKICAGAPGVY